eukprot:1626523-Rhodomonas_salina.1
MLTERGVGESRSCWGRGQGSEGRGRGSGSGGWASGYSRTPLLECSARCVPTSGGTQRAYRASHPVRDVRSKAASMGCAVLSWGMVLGIQYRMWSTEAGWCGTRSGQG